MLLVQIFTSTGGGGGWVGGWGGWVGGEMKIKANLSQSLDEV